MVDRTERSTNEAIQIPLVEAIQICANYFNDTNSMSTPGMEKHVFVELMNIATTSIELSFDNVVYKPIDEVAMAVHLGQL